MQAQPRIVSHTRAGVHYLAALLHANLETGAASYEELHYSHTRVPEGPYLHLYRQLLPTVISMWRVRDHLGVARSVSFADYIRTPMAQLPKASSGPAYYNGEYSERVCAPPVIYSGTVLERWLEYTRRFEERCACSVFYEEAVAAPEAVVELIGARFGLQSRQPFVYVEGRKGWQPTLEERPALTADDLALIRSFQCRLFTS